MIAELVSRAHYASHRSGFYVTEGCTTATPCPHLVGSPAGARAAALMLVVVELAKAVEADRAGNDGEFRYRLTEAWGGLSSLCSSVLKGASLCISEGTARHGGVLMLVVTELVEALEAIRADDVAGFREEIADAVIRLFDICGAHAIDLEAELVQKMGRNRERPHRHGKKY